MKYCVQLVSMTGDLRTRTVDQWSGGSYDRPGGAEMGADRLLKLCQTLFPDAHCNVLVQDEKGEWWDIDKYEQRNRERRAASAGPA